LIHTGVKAANAEVLVIVKAEEGRPILLDVVVQTGQIHALVKGRIETTGEAPEVAAREHRSQQVLVGTFEIEEKEKLIFPEGAADIPTKLLAAKRKIRGFPVFWESRCGIDLGGNFRGGHSNKLARASRWFLTW
jgi:hypothetical protein